MNKFKFIVLSMLLVCTITIHAQKEVHFELKDFPDVQTLTGEKMTLKEPLQDPVKMLLIDTLLFIQNGRTNPSFDVISLKTTKRVAGFCRKGRGPGELIYPFSFQYQKSTNEVYVQDLNGKKVVFYSLGKILKNDPANYTRIVRIDSVYPRKLMLTRDQQFFVSLLGHKQSFMNCKVDLNGKVCKMLDKFPETDIKYIPAVASNIFGTNMNISPDQSKVVLAYSHSSWIYIYDYNGTCTLKYIGPDFKELETGPSPAGPALSLRNKRRYWYPEQNNEDFLIPYSGKTRSESLMYENLFHLGYQGKLIRRYILTPVVSDIVVDWEKRIIYGLNDELEPTLYQYKF
jgi:hypothetical protein